MKIVAINGSPNRTGNTAKLVREALASAEESGAEEAGGRSTGVEVEHVFLADHRLAYCRGCLSNGTRKFCMSAGRCIIPDDMETLKEKLYEADGVVFASPSYGIEPTARMKNFITDRLGLYAVYTSALREKYFAGISTAGAIGAGTVAKKLARTFSTGFFGRGYVSGWLGVSVGNGEVSDSGPAIDRARELGRKMARDIARRRRYPFQALGKRIITRLMIVRNILAHRETSMRAVYETLTAQGVLR
jgi:multimeric flavodoxin WrbA